MRAPDEAMTAEEKEIFELSQRYLVELGALAPERVSPDMRLLIGAGALGLPLHGPAVVRLILSRARFFRGDPNDDEVVWAKAVITLRMYAAALADGPQDNADKKEIEELIAKECSRTECSRSDDLYLRRLASVFITNEVPLPLALREWVTHNIDKAPPPPSRGAPSTIYRDLVICGTLATIVQQWPNIKPTRTPARHGTGTPHSACSIMTMALRSLGVHKAESAVETIWRHRPRIPFETASK
jgi:hypothetical protein